MHSETPVSFPRFRAVAERAVLVEFGERVDEDIHRQVRRLDAALARCPVTGFTEAVPAYASILVGFDPLITDHARARSELAALIDEAGPEPAAGTPRIVQVCYDPAFGPDLQAVADRCGLTADAVIAAHLAGDYAVYMYGFAPGYAYLAGVPEAIRLPRKTAPVRNIPAGSVLIAGPQCLVTTLAMPTGWWIIGRSPTPILDTRSTERPFLFDVGDPVRFERISRDAFEAAAQGTAG
jgi:inhibitor of KinA